MLHEIRHRGPDDEGVWSDGAAGVSIGQRRLAIIDLSPGGHQPMTSSSGRFTITFNGEFYNYLDVRAELEALGVRFRSASDTEVLLEAIERWGLDAALARFAGMFAFALWDRDERRLSLARDRLGKKPLYYAATPEGVAFASELRPLEALGLGHDVDRGALTLLLRNAYVPQPYSIWRGIHKLPPASVLDVTPDTLGKAEPRAYWSMREVVARGARERLEGDDASMLARVDDALRVAVRERMIADVPLGAFLSGGIDSSLVVAVMQEQSERPVKTFTIGFHEADYDEAKHARRVAEHLGTEHTELYVTPEDAMKVIPRLARIYDEPFADSSQIPTFLVSELARRHVTVALSGDGGDEVFGGYNRYLLAQRLWRRMESMPESARRALGATILALPPHAYDAVGRALSPLLSRKGRLRLVGDKAHKLGRILRAPSPDAFYEELVTYWREPQRVVRGGFVPPTLLELEPRSPLGGDDLERMMYLDTVTYLPEDILVKVDRASMAVSLEARAPLLDHRLVELAWRLPLEMRVRGSTTKWALRQLLYRRVPRELIDRPKMGFGVPVGDWVRGPLRGWAEPLLEPARLRREGYFEPASVVQLWDQHVSGRKDHSSQLWVVLMFQQWLERQEEGAP